MILERISQFIQPKNLAIEISETDVLASEISQGVYYHRALNGTVSEEKRYEPIYLASVVQSSIDHFGKRLKRPNLLIAVSRELTYEKKKILVDILTLKWRCAKHVLMLDYIAAAAIGAQIDNGNVLLAENLSKKIYLIAMPSVTFMGLLFASGIIKHIKIDVGYEQLETFHIADGIDTLCGSISKEIPESFENIPGLDREAIQLLKKGWEGEINKHVYISAPAETSMRLGTSMGEYEFVYTRYDSHIVIRGVQAAVEKLAFSMS